MSVSAAVLRQGGRARPAYKNTSLLPEKWTTAVMNYRKKSIRDIDVRDKRVLVRCEFNVPMDEGGNITDDSRIRATLPTLRYLLDQGASLVLCSHMGRPKGKVVLALSMRPVARRLAELLEQEVIFVNDIVGEEAQAACAALEPGQVVMLQNLRFDVREEQNDAAFAGHLAALADVFVDDAFGTAHRAHASNHGVTQFLPGVCGLLIEEEIRLMGDALDEPKRPYVAIVGGSKIQDKLVLIDALLDQCDTVLVLGGMTYTFYKAMGGTIGDSLFDADKLELVGHFMERAKTQGRHIELPRDNIVADRFANDAEARSVPAGKIPEGYMGMDIGPKTIEDYTAIIKNAKTIVWNGPAGVFEMENFSAGTKAIAQAVVDSEAFSIIGGGDTIAAITQYGHAAEVGHVSTGGGASLEFIQGRDLPGIACLLDK